MPLKKEQIEKKYEEDKKNLSKKYADIEFAMKVSQIVAATAVGAIEAYELGPVAGTIAAALIVAAGVVAVGQANAEREAVKSLAVGGPTGPGINYVDESGQRVAGVVHQDEYVIPSWMRKLPQIQRMEYIIESVRQKGSYAAGGSVASNNSNLTSTNTTAIYTDPNMVQLLADISKKLDNPTRAKIIYTELETMDNKVANWKSNYGM